MKATTKRTFGISMLLVIGCAMLSLLKFDFAGCANDLLKESASPDGKWKAVVFCRDCGATTGFNTQIAIRPASEFFQDDRDITPFFVSDRDPNLEVAWTNDACVITFDPFLRTFRMESNGLPVKIVYQEIKNRTEGSRPLPPKLLGMNAFSEAELVAAKPEFGKPMFGCLKGKISLSPDFDAPLKDFKDYME